MSRDPIIVGTDGSATAKVAVDKAGELAHALGVPMHVVCVPSALSGHGLPPLTRAQQVVDEASQRLKSRGIAVETHVPDGDAAPALVGVAERERAQMIVVGNKGMTGVRRLLGSLPDRVSHQARCDVLVVPTRSRSLAAIGGRSIVVGTDGLSGALRAVKEAVRLSKALNSDLHVVSLFKPPHSPEAAVAEAATEASGQGVAATAHVLRDDPVAALLDVAKKHDASIIVVGDKGMHAGERVWLGNITDTISHKGGSSVLIVPTAEPSATDDDAVESADAGLSGEDAAT
jgi:nucleotide-binding universal stress UspA family protein